MKKLANFFIASESNNYRPPALSYKAFLIYGLLMLLLRLLLGTLPVHSAAVESQTLMDLINSERSSRNLNTLIIHPSLTIAANQKSQDMIDRDFFAHIDPDGNYVWPKIIAAGYGQYKILGENLAVDFLTSEGMVKAWLDSPTHRANLLHADFLEQGLVALYGDFQGRYANLTTSLFGTRLLSAVPAPNLPPPAPPPSPPEVKSEQKPAPASLPAEIFDPPSPTPPPSKKNLDSQAPDPKTTINLPEITVNTRAISISRIVFTLLGILFLGILALDSVIIMRHEAAINRSHSSNHLFGLMILVWVSILIWWW